VTIERATASNVDGEDILTVDQGEAWLRALAMRLLVARTRDTAREVFNQAAHEAGTRLPPNRDLAGRALRLLEKRLSYLTEKADREGRAP
jgi:hypothetical protein